MKINARIVLFFVVLLFTSLAAMADDYSFEVANNTDQAIKKILVSEDGKQFGQFNIGSGIPAGESAELVWDESTNGENCVQFFKAVFADGSESKATKFDFCEEGLTLEFE